MKNGIVIADAGPIISLALLDKLELLDELFDDIKIANAVWEEITLDDSKPFVSRITHYFSDKICHISSFNELIFMMDYGESESILLYKELDAQFLLIDDKKAREIAETLSINCVGTLGLLSVAKDKGLITALRPIFIDLIKHKRYYALPLLNAILEQKHEDKIPY